MHRVNKQKHGRPERTDHARRGFLKYSFIFLSGAVLQKSDKVFSSGKEDTGFLKKEFKSGFPLRNSEFSLVKDNGEIYLLPNFSFGKGLYFHRLNKVSGLIWELSDGKHSVNDIFLEITSKYEVDKKECLADLSEALTKMEQEGIIRF